MQFITLNELKDQLRIEHDYTDEDTLLTTDGNAAEAALLRACNRTAEDLLATFGTTDQTTGDVLPPPDFVLACLMLGKHLYEHRGPDDTVQQVQVPYSIDLMIKQFMRLTSAEDNVPVQVVTLGSDVKIAFTVDLPNDLTLADIDFSGKVLNTMLKDKEVAFDKAGCIAIEDGKSYVVLVDTEELGVGSYLLKVTVQIPDTDYQSGYRKEVVNINPHISVRG